MYALVLFIVYGLFCNNGGWIEVIGDAEVDLIEYGDRLMGFIADQDIGIIVGQQFGLCFCGYGGVWLVDQEVCIVCFYIVIDEYIIGVCL